MISQRTLNKAGFIRWQLSACFLQNKRDTQKKKVLAHKLFDNMALSAKGPPKKAFFNGKELDIMFFALCSAQKASKKRI